MPQPSDMQPSLLTPKRRIRRTLRASSFRFALLYAVLFALSYLVLGQVTYWIATAALEDQTRSAIEQEASAMHNRYLVEGRAALIGDLAEEGTAASGFKLYTLLTDAKGAVVEGNVDIAAPQTGWHNYPLPLKEAEGTEDYDEHMLTALGQQLEDGSLLLIGFDRYPILESQEAIVSAFLWSGGIMLLLAVSGGAFLGIRSLRRIDEFNRSLHLVMQGHLETRLKLAGAGDEMDELAQGVNATLERVGHLMESVKQVSSGIAHDLRTPLSRLRQRLETAAHRSQTPDEYKSAIEEALSQIDIILSTFVALLRIAQIEAGGRKQKFGTISLSQICSTVIEAYGASIEEEGRHLIANIAPDIEVQGDRDLLFQLLANLVENALRHTPAGSPIALTLSRDADGIRLMMEDKGPGIPASERENVLTRFYRLETSRTSPGSGLGLSLVKAVADLHEAGLVLEDAAPGLRVTLRWPASRSP
ncbi:MAG: HAMP domain-containing protein [Rhizobiales bacterium]|nr:HAMP domain-containing protein [Hyphomicrobiales bacterium]